MRNHQANAAVFCGATLLTTFLGFEAGGFFPGSTAVAAIGVTVALILRVAIARDPFGGLGWGSVLAVAFLALFAIWTLASSAWSHAPGRAVIEFNRAELYLLVLVLFASLPRRRNRMTALAGGFGSGCVVLCAAALATRTLPNVFPIAAEIVNDRLAYPLTYWNALGLLAVLGILMCLGLSASGRTPRAIRGLPAAAVPLLGATLVLTFSRGAIAAGIIGLVVLCATCPTRAMFSTLLATAPTTGFAVSVAYSATALATIDPTGPAAISEGRDVAAVAVLAGVAALALRTLLAGWDLDGSGARVRRGRVRWGVAVLAVVLIAGVGAGASAALDLPGKLSRQYHAFVATEELKSGQPVSSRLLSPANSGRLSTWRVALHGWRSEPFRGNGAGTYQTEWNRHRDNARNLVNAHSLYLEVLADLGIVGLALLAVCLIALLGGLARRINGSARAVAGSLLAAALSLLLRAGVDWDWQMPVLTWWLFAAGGLALARGDSARAALPVPGRLGRLLVMVGIGLLALLPVQVGLSQLNLNRAVRAFSRSDCNKAVGYALSSAAAIGGRAEPYEILGYCDARYGHRALAVTAIQNAINRDPKNWEFRYDMAIVRALGHLDPRPDASRAVALNPLSPLTTALARNLQSADPRIWRARAIKAPLLIP